MWLVININPQPERGLFDFMIIGKIVLLEIRISGNSIKLFTIKIFNYLPALLVLAIWNKAVFQERISGKHTP